MRNPEFVAAYVAKHLAPHLNDLLGGDQFHTFYQVERRLYDLPMPNVEDDEPVYELSIKYKNYLSPFTIKGRSFFLFELFITNFINLELTDAEGKRTTDDADALEKLLDRVVEKIDSDGIEFDTDISFKIKMLDGVNFRFTVSTMYWSESLHIVI
jgi:hypothetical protein